MPTRPVPPPILPRPATPLHTAPPIVAPLLAFALAAAPTLAPIPLAAGAATLAQPAPRAEAPAPHRGLDYTIDLSEAHTQTIRVSITAPDLPADAAHIDFILPAWRPGRYEILDPAGTVRDAAAHDDSGAPLPVTKIDKQTWRLTTNSAEAATLSYRVYANSLSNRTRHADDTHAFISPSSVLMYTPDRRDAPARVRIVAPDDWRIATGLDPADDDPRTLLAPDYDTLVDCPLEIGLHETQSFEVDGVPHEIVAWTAGAGVPRVPAEPEDDEPDDDEPDAAAQDEAPTDDASDAETAETATSTPAPPPADDEARPTYWSRLPADIAAIVRAQRDIFGDLPYRRFVYLIHAYPGGRGGTEHLNSTIMLTSPATFESRSAYDRFLSLVAHEMFHTWNVKQFRPAGLKPYDYTRENYTDLLWVAEGATSYYAPLTLVRAGLLDPDDHLNRLAGAIHDLRTRPGAAVQSLAESSFDAWIKFNKPTPDSVNSTVSFYDKGALVSLVLDLEIRRRTDNARSLDDAMRLLYKRFPRHAPGYTTADLLAILHELAGSPFDDFFAAHVSGLEPLDFESALAVVGLELRAPDDDDHGAYLGLNLSDQGGLASVTSVPADGPAHAAGVNPGDLIVALNGRRLRAGDLDDRTNLLSPGDPVRLTLLRHDRLREIEFRAAPRPARRPRIRRLKDPTDAQVAAYESWLGQPWPDRPHPEAANNDHDPDDTAPHR